MSFKVRQKSGKHRNIVIEGDITIDKLYINLDDI
jgi:hypothetical protein